MCNSYNIPTNKQCYAFILYICDIYIILICPFSDKDQRGQIVVQGYTAVGFSNRIQPG